MKENIFVSVVMPTFNGSKHLFNSIRSILNQTYKNFEFIIVNDGSIDDSERIINSFKDDRIVYIYQENKGPVFAYNKGFQCSKGEYVIIQDHDDESTDDRLAHLIEYAIDNKCDICGSFFLIRDERRGYTERIELPTDDMNIKNHLLYKPWSLFNPTLCIKKEVFTKYGYFNEQFKVGYDYEYFIRNLDHLRFGNIPKILYTWKKQNNSYGSLTKDSGEKIFIELSENKINEIFNLREPQKSNLIKGLANYYGNNPRQALHYFFKSFQSGNSSFQLFLYCGIILFMWPLVVLFRKTGLFSSPFIVMLKRTFNDIR